MAVSSSRDYSVTGTNIINGAFEYIGVKDANESVSANDTALALATLERMIKAWEAEGIGLWSLNEIALFQSYEGYAYDIYSSSSYHHSVTWYKTEIATAAASGASSIVVDSDDNITDGDYIGIELDDGTLQWTTVNGTPSSDTVALDDVLTDTSAVDNHVYNYTTKCPHPIEITEARIHRADGTDIPLHIASRDEYMGISDKTATGSATMIYFDPQRDRIKVNIWPACSDVQEYIRMTAKLSIMDMDAATNNPDFPQAWYEALETNLAVRLGAKFGRPITQELALLAALAKQNASNFDREQTSTFISFRRT